MADLEIWPIPAPDFESSDLHEQFWTLPKAVQPVVPPRLVITEQILLLHSAR